MRFAPLLLLCPALHAQAPAAAAEFPLTRAEAAQAVELLSKSQGDFLKSLEGLSESQLHFKAAPEKWSILECAEHITTVESLVAEGIIDKALKEPAQPSRRAEIGVLDITLITSMIDRSKKFKAPDFVAPKGNLKDLKAVQEAYRAAHARLSASLEKGDGLRTRVAPHPAFGPMDLYQWILLVGGHTARHTLQILEVKAAPGYPKS